MMSYAECCHEIGMSDKQALRKFCLKKRHEFVQNLDEESLESLSIRLVDKFHSYFVFPSQCTIGTYYSTADEISARLLNFSFSSEGHIVAYPRVEEDSNLTFRQVTTLSQLEDSSYGVKQAPCTATIVEPDLFIVPLLAFDSNCNRLGYGKGHFDRALEKARHARKVLAIGIAYDIQKVDNIICDPHDQRLDYVVTESQIYKAI